MSRGRKTSAPRSAYSRGLDLLARREHSRRELRGKLAKAGHSCSDAEEAIDRLGKTHLQSDERYAAVLARTRSAHGYGPRRIAAELKSQGIVAEQLQAALDSLDIDWYASASAQLRRRFGTASSADAAERARRAQFLLRRGFDPATVRRVTRADAGDPDDGFD